MINVELRADLEGGSVGFGNRSTEGYQPRNPI